MRPSSPSASIAERNATGGRLEDSRRMTPGAVVRTRIERVTSWPLWVHAIALLVMLTAWAAYLGAGGLFSVDEGIAAVQAQVLADTGDWTVAHPLDRFDDGHAFPLRSAERTPEGIVPYGKHPLYPTVLAGAHRAFGTLGMVGVSLVGTVLAAVTAALLARRLDARLGIPSLYVTGVMSPLLFDSTLLIAHSLGAAAAGVAAVALLRHHESDRGLLSYWLLLACPALVALVMLRGEGLLLVGSLGAVSLVSLLTSRRAAWWSTGAVVAASAGAAVGLERLWRKEILGDAVVLPYASAASAGNESWLSDRLRGLVTITLKVSYTDSRTQLLLLAACALLLTALVAIRRGEDDERVVLVSCGLAAALAVAWTAGAPRSAVPGIAVAFPFVWFGLGLEGRTRNGISSVLLATSGVFLLCVVATQYPEAGSLEWGARYLAICLPLTIPVAVAGYSSGIAWLDRRLRMSVHGAFLIVALCLLFMAAATQRPVNDFNIRMQEQVSATAPPSSFGATDEDRRPVVVSGEFNLPQTIWPVYEDARWLRLRDDGDPPLEVPDSRILAMLEAGLDRFTFITTDLERDRPLLGSAVTVGPDQGFGMWSIVVVEAR